MKKFLLISAVNIFLLAALSYFFKIAYKSGDLILLSLFVSFIITPFVLSTFNFRVSGNIILSLFLTLSFLTIQYGLDYWLLADTIGEHDVEAYFLAACLSFLIATGYCMLLNWLGNIMFFIKEDRNLSRKSKIINMLALFLLFCLFFILISQSSLDMRESARNLFNLPN